MSFKAVFFDAGDTMVYPHPSFPELFTLVVRAEGHAVDPALVREKLFVFADRFTETARAGQVWSTAARSRPFWRATYRAFLGELGLPFSDGLADRLYAAFTDLANYRIFPDVLPALERLHAAGLTLGVISNFEEWLELLLESLDLTRFFGVQIISGVEGVEKPDQRIFHLALERTGMAPEESVYVGDSPAFDIEPAAAVGMHAILIDRRGRHSDHSGPRLASLEDLPEMIGVPS